MLETNHTYKPTATSFFLGILFSLFPYDYPILWVAAPAVPSPPDTNALSPYDRLELHLAFLYSSPAVVQRIFHIVIGTGLLGFFIKLYRPSESNMLFDGASLCLYMIAVIIYLTNIVKGMRAIAEAGTLGSEGMATGLAEPGTEVGDSMMGIVSGPTTLGREDSLKVLSASNTILALVLLGVLVLQAGQWYAERKQGQEEAAIARERAERREERERRGGATGTGADAGQQRGGARRRGREEE